MKTKYSKKAAVAISLLFLSFWSYAQIDYVFSSVKMMTIYDIEPEFLTHPMDIIAEGESEEVFYYGPMLVMEGEIINKTPNDFIIDLRSADTYKNISNVEDTLLISYSYKGKQYESIIPDPWVFCYKADMIEKGQRLLTVIHPSCREPFYISIPGFFSETGLAKCNKPATNKYRYMRLIPKGKRLARISDEIMPTLSLRLIIPERIDQ